MSDSGHGDVHDIQFFMCHQIPDVGVGVRTVLLGVLSERPLGLYHKLRRGCRHLSAWQSQGGVLAHRVCPRQSSAMFSFDICGFLVVPLLPSPTATADSI